MPISQSILSSTKLLLYNFIHLFISSILGQNIFFRSVTSNILSLRSSLILKDQVLETFKTKSKITRVSHNVCISRCKARRQNILDWMLPAAIMQALPRANSKYLKSAQLARKFAAFYWTKGLVPWSPTCYATFITR